MADGGRDAAALAVRCIQAIADKDVAELRELFADDGKWELAYGLSGLSDAQRTVHGGDKVALFHRGLNSVIERVTFPHVEAFAVNERCAVLAAGTNASPKFGLTVMFGLKLIGNALKLNDASSHELFVICTS